jgi:hypothetical protein
MLLQVIVHQHLILQPFRGNRVESNFFLTDLQVKWEITFVTPAGCVFWSEPSNSQPFLYESCTHEEQWVSCQGTQCELLIKQPFFLLFLLLPHMYRLLQYLIFPKYILKNATKERRCKRVLDSILNPFLFILRSRDSSVGIATGYRLDDRGVEDPVGARFFFFSRRPDRL